MKLIDAVNALYISHGVPDFMPARLINKIDLSSCFRDISCYILNLLSFRHFCSLYQ